eukprot:10191596-Heterocapsa_arctica.AAC.1
MPNSFYGSQQEEAYSSRQNRASAKTPGNPVAHEIMWAIQEEIINRFPHRVSTHSNANCGRIRAIHCYRSDADAYTALLKDADCDQPSTSAILAGPAVTIRELQANPRTTRRAGTGHIAAITT